MRHNWNMNTYIDKSGKPVKLEYGLYCRKSSESEERQVLSLDSQEAKGKELAAKQNIKVDPKFLWKESKSAKDAGKRPMFSTMIEEITKGRINALIAWHPDRFSRNALDAATLVTLMDSGKLLEIVTDGQVFKAENPMDKFFFAFLCSTAKMQNDQKGIDVKRGLNDKVKLGSPPIQAPMGYKNIGEKGDREIIPDSDRFEKVQQLFRWLLDGSYTPMQILKKATIELDLTNNRTGKRLTRSNLYYMFHNPFYSGTYEYPRGSGKWMKCKHVPMISEAEYRKIQLILSKKAHPFSKLPSESFPFKKRIDCGECGASVTAENKDQLICSHCKHKFACKKKDSCPKCNIAIEEMKSPKFLHYTYYHCTKRKKTDKPCSQKGITEEELGKQFIQLLKQIEIPKELHQWAIKELRVLHGQEIRNRAASIGAARRGYDSEVAYINRLVQLRLREEITQEELRDMRVPSEARKVHFKELIEDTDKLAPRVGLEPTTNSLTGSCSTIELPRNMWAAFSFIEITSSPSLNIASS
jgi:site-specific DNA recombinase